MDDLRSASGGLRAFQDSFAAALFAGAEAPGMPPQVSRLVAQPGFAVYRNTVMKGCIDALQANYPAVVRLMGEAWFRAAAALYVPAHLPRRPSLLDYGHDFADFLATFEPAAEYAWLPDVARLERFWTEAHGAADALPLPPAAIAGMPPARLAVTALAPHPTARWVWFADHPCVTIWSRNRILDELATAPTEESPKIDWHAEGVLITRPRGHVQWAPLSQSGYAFLDACARGGTLADAAIAALDADAGADLAALMAQLLEAGAFAGDPLHAVQPEEVIP